MRPLISGLLFAALALGAVTARSEALVAPGPVYAADRAALTRAVRGASVADLPGGALLLSPAPFEPVIATDPRYRWRFSRALSLYTPAGPTGMARRATIHFEPADMAAAERTARLISRLMRLHRDHFARETAFPRGATEVHVWLSPEKTPQGAHLGGEARDNHLYVFATATPRTAIEWTRTIAHEWGHLTLPAARGFTQPENDAAGMLGERLYLKWLRETTSAADGDDWTEAAGLRLYYERQIAPLIEQYRQQGPGSSVLNGWDAAAMDLYIGAILASDDSLGSLLTGKALFTILGEHPIHFFNALATAIAGRPRVPVRLPAWIPLADTTYRVSLHEGTSPASVAFADRPALALTSDGVSLRVRQAGWKWVRSASGDARTVVLQPEQEAPQR